tara:strand:- start:5484 stop:7058 length:1575 start_codon:yes stop_codon:yes gene_type:complete
MEYLLSLFIGTFILEDVALVSCIALISEGKISTTSGFLACFLGISIGDIGLYFLGRHASQIGLGKKINSSPNIQAALLKIKSSNALNYLIFISRLIPGARLPTYVAAGIIKYSALRFSYLTFISVGIWVAVALAAGKTVHYFLMDYFWLSLLVLTTILYCAKILIPKLADKWERKALMHSWRKWLHFEFWPAWFFYIPVVFYYVYFSFRYRSFLNPFYTNPKILNSGLIGESKWDFLKYLDPNQLSTLRAFKVSAGTNFNEFMQLLANNDFSFPFILKPDVGQRGFAVRIIKDEFDLAEYLLQSQFDLIAQKLSRLPKEAGIFYVRDPSAEKGFLFSITDKEFPFVLANGKNSLGELILKDPRARIIASTYFSRWRNRLDEVPKENSVVFLSECGNHCQGAIFKNGNHLMTEKLLDAVEVISQSIPHFYFGRFDVRYENSVALKNGKFEIVEINGAGSEATHIWDSNTKLLDAYKVLFKQWSLLFEIGYQIKKTNSIDANVNLKIAFREIIRVNFRSGSLTISS